jgi:SAM-dependent methyltransferase
MVEPQRDGSLATRACSFLVALRRFAVDDRTVRGAGHVIAVTYLAARARDLLEGIRKDSALLRAAELLDGATALEPGGPSALFGAEGAVPAYPRLDALDTLDYAERTLWSDASNAGSPTDVAVRRRLIGEASEIDVADNSYDAVISSHVLEHLANPLGALAEWRRVVRPGGYVLLIVPHRDATFDHRRPVTTLDHLHADAAHRTGEDDVTHLEEVLRLHDLERDPGAPGRAVFEQRCREAVTTRALHHHVFVSRTVAEACAAAGLEVLMLRPKRPLHIVCLCRVGDGRGRGLSDAELVTVERRSPFPSDRANAAEPSTP